MEEIKANQGLIAYIRENTTVTEVKPFTLESFMEVMENMPPPPKHPLPKHVYAVDLLMMPDNLFKEVLKYFGKEDTVWGGLDSIKAFEERCEKLNIKM